MARTPNGNGDAEQTDTPPEPGHNGPTDAEIQKHIRWLRAKDREVQEARDVVKSLTGEYRAAVKSMKKSGVQTDVLLRVLAERKAEGDKTEKEIAGEQREWVRMRALCGIPVHQADLFGAVATPFDHDSEAAQAQRVFDANDDGYRAGTLGRDIDETPHHQTEASEEFTAWRAGWHRGQAHLARELTPPKTRGRRSASGNPEDRPAA